MLLSLEISEEVTHSEEVPAERLSKSRDYGGRVKEEVLPAFKSF